MTVKYADAATRNRYFRSRSALTPETAKSAFRALHGFLLAAAGFRKPHRFFPGQAQNE